MAETAKPTFLGRWIACQRQKDAKRVDLQECLFGLPLWRYLVFRSRYSLFVLGFRLATHVAEFSLAILTVPAAVGPLMLLRLASTAIEGGWWGVMEPMRLRIRNFGKQQQFHSIQRELSAWISLALILACLLVAASVGWFLLFKQAGSLLGWLVLALALQTGLRLISRSYFSGVYALRRVFVPVEMLIAPELIILLLGFALHPYLQQWTVIVCIVLSSFISFAISTRYIQSTMAFLRLKPARIWSAYALRKVFDNAVWRELAKPGASTILMRVHPLVFMAALQHMASMQSAYHAIYYAAYLIMPLMRSGMHWGQLMYFDLSRTHLDLFAGFRRALERSAFGFSFCYCTLMAALSLAILFALTAVATSVAFLLCFYLQLAGMYGFLQVALFIRHAHAALITISLLHFAALAWLATSNAGIGWVIAPLSLALLLGWFYARKDAVFMAHSTQPYLPWINQLLHAKKTQLLCLRLDKHLTAPQCQSIAQRLISTLDGQPRATFYQGYLLIYGMTTRPKAETLVLATQGSIVCEEWINANSGHEALRQASHKGWLSLAPFGEIETKEQLMAQFLRDFPQGEILYPMHKNTALWQATTPYLRRQLVHDARLAIELGNRRRMRHFIAKGWMVTALYDYPHIHTVFLAPLKPGDAARRAGWMKKVDAYNLRPLRDCEIV